MNNPLYIDLLKKVLIDYHRMELGEYKPIYVNNNKITIKTLKFFDNLLRKKNYAICKVIKFNPSDRLNGLDWPTYADTMVGLKRLENIQYCFQEVIKNNIPGDFIETGVWRGGSVIFMAALLKDSNITNRTVWVADSFEGLPKPNAEKYVLDKGDMHYMWKELAIPLEQVKNNFRKYDLLGDNVKFLKGWFKDTLPTAPIEKLAILRLDGDLYESTMDGLVNLYPKVSKGGFIIIDDWGALDMCKQAVIDYRNQNNITDEIITIDNSSVYWKKG